MDIEAAVKHLESFVEVSKKSGDWTEQQKACSSLGEMLNSLVIPNFFTCNLISLFNRNLLPVVFRKSRAS